MADIRCSHCGENNPDFLDVCQYCQSPLKSESMLHAGEAPSAKDTDELEPILPEWLQDARQQSRDSEDADTFSPETRPKVQKNEPVDLLAGLSSQDDSDDDEDVPDWLASINPFADKKSPLSSASDDNEEEPSDFFAQFSQPTETKSDEPAQDDPGAVSDDMESQDTGQTDELSNWFSEQSPDSSEPVSFGEFKSDSAEDKSWMDNLGEPTEPIKDEAPVEKEPEDLSWLHDLETSSKQTDEIPSHEKETEFDLPAVQSDSSGEDLSWLDNLGGTPAPAADTPSQSEKESDDLGWLNDLGGTPVTDGEEPAPSKSESSQDDLGWLNDLGGTPVSDTEEPVPSSQPESSEDDLGWMKNLSETSGSEPETPASSESSEDALDWMKNLGDAQSSETEEPAPVSSSDDNLDWMKNLGDAQTSETHEPTPFASSEDALGWMKNLGEDTAEAEGEPSTPALTPPGTAPLEEGAGIDSTPDWLKSAMEGPSMPAPGDLSMDWFKDSEKEPEADAAPEPQPDETSDSSLSEPVSETTSFDLPLDDSPDTSQQDLDAMFNIDIPDLDQEGESLETQSESAGISSDDASLAPVDLPSWVQDMRPVDSAISRTSYSYNDDQETESEGPLAGFSGVIPSAPIGSSLRPKAFSMKLQVTDEQQAGAALMEQIIASESAAHAPASKTEVASQRMLRLILSAVLVGVISIMLLLGTQSFGIVGASNVSDLIGTIPESSPVLVVVDYEPAVAGELAAAAGPVLDQLASSKQSTFTFLAMSPNGSAMVEHLMLTTNVSGPVEDGGFEYRSGVQYFNAGFLPGGSTGVVGFIDNPVSVKTDALALANISDFSSFEAVIVITDNADSGRVWVEQLEVAKQARPEIAFKPLVVVSSAQAGPMLEPYESSGQVDVLVSGLSDAAKYEFVNQSRPGIARGYWDSFGIGLMVAVLAIILGSIWSVLSSIRERRAEAEQG